MRLRNCILNATDDGPIDTSGIRHSKTNPAQHTAQRKLRRDVDDSGVVKAYNTAPCIGTNKANASEIEMRRTPDWYSVSMIKSSMFLGYQYTAIAG
jgi:hypothetical protein